MSKLTPLILTDGSVVHLTSLSETIEAAKEGLPKYQRRVRAGKSKDQQVVPNFAKLENATRQLQQLISDLAASFNSHLEKEAVAVIEGDNQPDRAVDSGVQKSSLRLNEVELEFAVGIKGSCDLIIFQKEAEGGLKLRLCWKRE